MCCKLLAIPALEKPGHNWCPKFVTRKGCSIYADRPSECRGFECLYLAAPALDESWRPDKARFMVWVGSQGRRLIVEVDPTFPGSWKREPFYSELRRWANRNNPEVLEVVVRTGHAIQMLFPEGEVDMGPEQDLKIESGYEPGPGGYRPFARYIPATPTAAPSASA